MYLNFICLTNCLFIQKVFLIFFVFGLCSLKFSSLHTLSLDCIIFSYRWRQLTTKRKISEVPRLNWVFFWNFSEWCTWMRYHKHKTLIVHSNVIWRFGLFFVLILHYRNVNHNYFFLKFYIIMATKLGCLFGIIRILNLKHRHRLYKKSKPVKLTKSFVSTRLVFGKMIL